MKNVEKKRKYQREWIANRRKSWFSENGPCKECGSKDNLVLHHVKPEEKEHHAIWSWSEERRNEELDKCIILCSSCHIKLHAAIQKIERAGEASTSAKLKNDDVLEIKKLLEENISGASIARKYSVDKSTIYKIKKGITWSHLR